MIDEKDKELNQEFSVQELYKQVVENSRENRKQLKQIISDITLQINNVVDFQLLSPEMSTYMSLLVKNDQLILKLATALTRINKQINDSDSDQQNLSYAQQKQLIEKVKRQINPIFMDIKNKVNDNY